MARTGTLLLLNVVLVTRSFPLLTTTLATLRDSCVSHLIVTALKYLSGLLEGFETLPACFGRT
jgi:hypothetical protein